MTRHCVTLSIVMLCLAGTAIAEQNALLEATGQRGGICLVLGAGKPDTAGALAADSAMFVLVVQPDAKPASEWAAAFAADACAQRENLSVLNTAFKPDDYATNLFNLVVVEDAAALGDATLADLCRITAPNGFVALKDALASFAAEAKTLGMQAAEPAGPWKAIYCKPVRPVTWKMPVEVKWRAGPRSQIAGGWSGVCTADGKLFYVEQMERNEGILTRDSARVIARDAYNGRILWFRDMPGNFGRRDLIALAAMSTGRLFVRTSTKELFCWDGNTGKTLFELPHKVDGFTRLATLPGDLLYVHGTVCSSETGKVLWKYPTYRYQPLPGTIIGENIFFCDGQNIFARKLATGEQVWSVSADTVPGSVSANALSRAGDNLLVRLGAGNDQVKVALLGSADGKLMWTHEMKVRISPNERYFDSRNVVFTTVDDKLLIYYRHNQSDKYADEVVGTLLNLADGKPVFEDRVSSNAGDFHGCFSPMDLGDHMVYYDLWLNKKTLETTPYHMPHPACFIGSHDGFGLAFDFPSRKSGPLSAVGPVDAPIKAAARGEIVRRGVAVPQADDTQAGDWPMFRGRAGGGNFVAADPGVELVKSWEVQVGLGKTDFGFMSSRRTGLSQAVLAYGLAIVSDMDAQRVVALDATTGRQQWVFPLAARSVYPPTLYKGLCLVAARDGCVYCLDAKTGRLVYQLRVPSAQRLVGGWEKLESRWPLDSDVLIAGGVAYVAGGAGGLAFKPETGEPVEAKDPGAIALGRGQTPGGRDLVFSYDEVIKGNSIPRTNEDNVHGFQRASFGRKLDARVLAWDDKLTVAYRFNPAGEGWANKGKLTIAGITGNPAKPAWTTDPIELVVDDIVLTPDRIYCAGHYQRVDKEPEVWVLSREDGKVLATVPAGAFPGFMGMSASGNRLYVSTRDGKLVCFAPKAGR